MSSDSEPDRQTFNRATLLRRGAGTAASLAAAGMLPGLASARTAGVTLNLVAYSTPKPVMSQLITNWTATPQGQGVSFSQSYGPSTSQAQAIAAGQPADIAFLSWPGDIQILVDAGLVNANWDEQSYDGIVANTVVVFALRDGNPKKIKGWNDLIRPGVQVVTPDPFSSGSAKWNILAAYSAQRHLGKTDAQAVQYVRAAVQERRRAADLRHERHRRVPLRQGRRAHHVRERGDQRQPQGREHPVRDPAADAADPAADRRDPGEPEQEPREPVHPVHQADALAGGLRAVRLPAGEPRGGERGSRSSRSGPGQITLADKTIGGFAAAQKRWFDSSNGLMYSIESGDGGPSS